MNTIQVGMSSPSPLAELRKIAERDFFMDRRDLIERWIGNHTALIEQTEDVDERMLMITRDMPGMLTSVVWRLAHNLGRTAAKSAVTIEDLGSQMLDGGFVVRRFRAWLMMVKP